MLVLGIDTSDGVAVALLDGDDVVARTQGADPRRHAETLAPAIAWVLDEAGVSVRSLAAVAVGTGPAPFTGLRVGLVTARALARATGIPAYGVCSLDALARQAFDVLARGVPDSPGRGLDAARSATDATGPATDASGTVAALGAAASGTVAPGTAASGTAASGTVASGTVASGTVASGTVASGTVASGTVVVVTDARRHEVYTAQYRRADDAPDTEVERITQPAVIAPAVLRTALESRFAGPRRTLADTLAAGEVAVVGQGTRLYPELFPAHDRAPTTVDPAVLARLALRRAGVGGETDLEPRYLRRPDVTPPAARKRAS